MLQTGHCNAGNYPSPKEGDWIAREFRFNTGEVMPELRLHYRTIGDPSGEPVLVLHGTAGTGASMLTPDFAGELFGPGQPLDADKYFIILPDAIGAGGSSKPSDGLRTRFPAYHYDDMVLAQHRLLTEHLNIGHLRLLIGNSMGGMHAWIWGARYPEFMDALVPMASQPTEMSGRNWMLRRMLIEMVRNDPEYRDGQYISQPSSLRFSNAFFALATNGGTLACQKQAPTVHLADKYVDARLAQPFTLDANDFLYQWGASRGYNAAPGLENIKATVLAINAADDERYPPETGLMERAMQLIPNGRLLLIPASEDTCGHGTSGLARFYKRELHELLQTTPRRIGE
ncbi:homoserine O-acetyltransferase [Paraburkholderia sp. BL18I3N2]|uniref:alpha/beta fold hydrolase n=1 Tax=Paraburkholderia sp. BL18I3N2 TaxID=1938799 RepID=UPI000D07D10C|nr:alpha/beta fold hydrolase [Paraburkholderia sp. BL18I3N2]PRX32811.1 homoserine O-acetyltransferase [Paraburkholderia sp. BL18I3N2]